MTGATAPDPGDLPRDARIYVTGHRGLVGGAILRALQSLGFRSLIIRTRQELDLRDGAAVDRLFAAERPEHVFLAAARVGGILENSRRPADFLRDNLLIQTSVIDAAHRHGAKRLLFLGSTCIYPKHAPQPMRPEHLLTGPVEPTNEAYAVAKIAGVKMCEGYRRQFGSDFRAVIPANAYGPGDRFDESGHVVAALVRRFHEAKAQGLPEVVLWGTGTPKRELLYVDDLASACVFLMGRPATDGLMNVGSGEEVSILELAERVKRVVGYAGAIRCDPSRPDGMPRRLLDSGPLRALGWRPRVPLEEGIRRTVAAYAAIAAKA